MKPHFIVGDHTGNFQKPNPLLDFLNEYGLAGISLPSVIWPLVPITLTAWLRGIL
jgi:hypothetical protein